MENRFEILVDCDKYPFIPKACYVEAHRKGGRFTWDSGLVRLWQPASQNIADRVPGEVVRHDVIPHKPYNANLLDYLLSRPQLIPEEWKGKTIFFWGTLYRTRRNRLDPKGTVHVRALYWDPHQNQWRWNARNVTSAWHADDFAAVPAT